MAVQPAGGICQPGDSNRNADSDACEFAKIRETVASARRVESGPVTSKTLSHPQEQRREREAGLASRNGKLTNPDAVSARHVNQAPGKRSAGHTRNTTDLRDPARELVTKHSSALKRINYDELSGEIAAMEPKQQRAMIKAIFSNVILKSLPREKLHEALDRKGLDQAEDKSSPRPAPRMPSVPATATRTRAAAAPAPRPVPATSAPAAPSRSVIATAAAATAPSGTCSIAGPSDPAADEAAAAHAYNTVKTELAEIAKVYEQNPGLTGLRRSSWHIRETIANPLLQNREKIASRMERIGAALRALTPTQVDRLVDKKYMTDEQLTQLAQYDSGLQGYLGFEKLMEQSVPAGQLDEIRRRAPFYNPTATHPSPVFSDLLAGKVQDPLKLTRLLAAYHSASQVKDADGNFWSGSPALRVDASIEATNIIAQYGLGQHGATPDYHANIIAMGRNYIACHPAQKLALVQALIPQVQTEAQYPDTAIKAPDPGDGDKFHALRQFGDARGVLVADAIADMKQEGDTGGLHAAFAQLDGALSFRYAVSRAALQSFRLTDTATDVAKQVHAALEETGWVEIKHYVGSIGTDHGPVATFDGIGGDPEPLRRLIGAAMDPSLLNSAGSPESRADQRAHAFEAAAEAIEWSAGDLGGERPITLLEMGSHEFVKNLLPALTGMLEDHTSLMMAALRSHQEPAPADAAVAHDPAMGAAALTKYFIFAYDDEAFKSWASGRPGTLPLLDTTLKTVWARLRTGDTETLDPAKYFFTGLSFNNFPYLRTIGSKNLGFFVGAYAGAHHMMGTLFDKDLEAMRYQKRGVLSVVKELPAFIPGGGGKVYWWAQGLLTGVRNGVKAGFGYNVETTTGAEIAQRNQILDENYQMENLIRAMALPEARDIARMPFMQLYHPAVHKESHISDTVAWVDFDNEVKNARDGGYNIRDQWTPRRQW